MNRLIDLSRLLSVSRNQPVGLVPAASVHRLPRAVILVKRRLDAPSNRLTANRAATRRILKIVRGNRCPN